MEETIEERFLRHMRITYKARYAKHRRLLKVDTLQKIASIFISSYITVASTIILSNAIVPQNKIDSLNVILVALSIIALVLSITLGQTDNKNLAEQFHLCAREIQRLYEKIILLKDESSTFNFSDYQSEYNNILDKYPINHDEIDREHVIYEKWKENNKTISLLIKFKIKYFFLTYCIYLFLMLAPIVISVVVIIK